MRADLRDKWLKNGYVVVRHLFDEKRTQKLQAISEKILQQWRTNNPETGNPCGGPQATVMRHLNHWGYFDNPPHPLCDLMDAVADKEVLAVGRERGGQIQMGVTVAWLGFKGPLVLGDSPGQIARFVEGDAPVVVVICELRPDQRDGLELLDGIGKLA